MDALTLFMSAASAGGANALGPPLGHAIAAYGLIAAAPAGAALLLATTVRAIDSGLLASDETGAGAGGALTASRRILLGCAAGAGATTESGEPHGCAASAAIAALDEVVRIALTSVDGRGWIAGGRERRTRER